MSLHEFVPLQNEILSSFSPFKLLFVIGYICYSPPPPNIDPEKYLSFTVYLNQFKKIGKKIDKSIRVDHMDRQRSTTDYEWEFVLVTLVFCERIPFPYLSRVVPIQC